MLSPVRCLHCGQTYDLGEVSVTARYTDCSVWTTPCCNFPGVDDRPGVKERHYREIDQREVEHGAAVKMMLELGIPAREVAQMASDARRRRR